jgi:EAL domain-containing protein (putative c-di-GMP-specific phosphodiesterase class I)
MPEGLRLHVNLSPKQLHQHGIVASVQAALERFDLPGSILGLEITETAMMADPAASALKLATLKDMGVHISIDDFGTGYSSLGYLQRFPIDALKIDRAFVADMEAGGKNTEIVRAVAALGRELRLHVVAEGVETRAQAGMLADLGCGLAQGYYFGRPMPRAKATAMLARLARAHSRLAPAARQPEVVPAH